MSLAVIYAILGDSHVDNGLGQTDGEGAVRGVGQVIEVNRVDHLNKYLIGAGLYGCLGQSLAGLGVDIGDNGLAVTNNDHSSCGMGLAVIYAILGDSHVDNGLAGNDRELYLVDANGVVVKLTLEAEAVGAGVNVLTVLADGEGIAVADGHLIGLGLTGVVAVLKTTDGDRANVDPGETIHRGDVVQTVVEAQSENVVSSTALVEEHVEGQVKFLSRYQRGGDAVPSVLVINLILDIASLAIGVLIVAEHVCGMSLAQVIPALKVKGLDGVLEAVVARHEGLLVLNLTNTDEVRQLDALASRNGAILPAEAKGAVIAAVLNHVVGIDIIGQQPVVNNNVGIVTHDLAGIEVVVVLTEPVVIGRSHTGNTLTKESAEQRRILDIALLHLHAIGVALMHQALQWGKIVDTDHDVAINTSADSHSLVVIVGQRVNDPGGHFTSSLQSCCHSHAMISGSIQAVHIDSIVVANLQSGKEAGTTTVIPLIIAIG